MPKAFLKVRSTRALWLALFAVLMLVPVRSAAAQEVQIPFDTAGRLEVVDRDRAERLSLFVDEFPGFVEARLFQAGDSIRLEILSRRDGATVRTTRDLSAVELADLRQRFSLPARDADAAPSANARTALLATSTLLGLTVYGPALPIAFDVDSRESSTALYMATASASFFVPWLLTKDVTPGMAQAAFYGSTRGFGHGAALHYLIAGGGDDSGCGLEDFDDCDDVRNTLASGVLGGVVEAVAGYRWARSTGMTGGEANAISLGGDWGLLSAMGLAVVTGIADDDPESDTDDRTTIAMGLLGSAGGLALGHAVGERRDFTYGDVEVISTSGWLGTYLGWAIAEKADAGRKGLTASAVAGGTLGIVLADRLVAETDFTYGQSALVRLGAFAGGLLGYGTGVLLDSEGSETTALTSGIGALAGFLATHAAVSRSATVGLASDDLQIDLAPLGVAALMARSGTSAAEVPMPVASVRYRF